MLWCNYEGVVAKVLNNTVTGVETLNASQELKIYPNPFNKECLLQLEEEIQRGSLLIYNSIGQLVKEINEKQIIISRSDLPSGLYFIHVTDEKKSSRVSKIIITD